MTPSADLEAFLAFRPHPLTCPNRGDGKHVLRDGKDLGELETIDGRLRCVDCDYIQLTPYEMSAAKHERDSRRTALLREAATTFEGGVFNSEDCADLAARIRKELGE